MKTKARVLLTLEVDVEGYEGDPMNKVFEKASNEAAQTVARVLHKDTSKRLAYDCDRVRQVGVTKVVAVATETD